MDSESQSLEMRSMSSSAIIHEDDTIDLSDNREFKIDGVLSKDEDEIIGESIVNEIITAIYEARYLGSLLALLGLLIGYQLTIAPYRNNMTETTFNDIELWKIRPVLSESEQRLIRYNTMNAETQFTLPLPSYNTIKLRYHSAATHKGVHQPPELFYEGVVFGLTDMDSHQLEYHRHRELHYNNMYEDLKSMKPTPTNIMLRSSQFNETKWKESGFALYFSYKDLEKQGKLSSDKLQPWKRVLEDVLAIARNYRQVCLTVWYPHEFGRPSKEEDKFRDQDNKDDENYDKHLYETIVQLVIPTRTGLTSLASTVPVWMSAINYTAPEKKPVVYRKEWDEEDHWEHYKEGGKRWYPTTSLEAKKTKEDESISGDSKRSEL